MDEQWLYYCAGMHVNSGLKVKSSNGAIGVTSGGEIIMFNNKGEVYDRGPAAQAQLKFGLMSRSLNLGGHKYQMEFHPMSRNFAGAAGGLIGAAIANSVNTKNDSRSEKQKQQEFVAAVNQFQAH
jgi:hypothetical protein